MRAERIRVDGWEACYRLSDPDGFVMLHRTVEGRAFGGTRIRHYASPTEALEDARRLSRAMTLKCAVNGLPGGGGKAVLEAASLGDRQGALEAYGDFVESLGGRFYTGPDLGVGAADIPVIARRTAHVAHQDLSPAAAAGVYWSMRGATEAALGTESLGGLRAAIQGLGAVGWKLVELLLADGTRVVAQDANDAVATRARGELGVEIVSEGILEREADVFAPCAVGQVIRADNLDRLAARIVCGAANNQLATEDLDVALQERRITYVPDFVASSGATIQGVLTAVHGAGDYSDRVAALRGLSRAIVAEATRRDVTPTAAAMALAGRR